MTQFLNIKCLNCGKPIPVFKPCGKKRTEKTAKFCSKSCSAFYGHKNNPNMKKVVERFKENGVKGEAWGWVKKYRSLKEEDKQSYLCDIKKKILDGLVRNNSQTLGSKAEIAFYDVLKNSFPNTRIIHHDTGLLKGYDFDFSFPDHRLAVEWNGPPHYDPGFYNFKFGHLWHRRRNDDYKKRKIEEMNWKLIEIYDDSYYKNGSELSDIMTKAIDRITYYISKDLTTSEIFMNSARDYSKLSTCNRLSVGTVIVKNGRIVSTGTNGSPDGQPHCKDVGCLMDDRGHCVRTTHSEQNAILACMRNGVSTDGAILYCTDFPCTNCLKSIAQSGISLVCFERDYDDGTNKILAKELRGKIKFYRYDKTKFIEV